MARKKKLFIILTVFAALIIVILSAYFSIDIPANASDIDYSYTYDTSTDLFTIQGTLTNGNRVRQVSVSQHANYENVTNIAVYQAPSFFLPLSKNFSVSVPVEDYSYIDLGNKEYSATVLGETSLNIYLEEVQNKIMKRSTVLRGRPIELSRILKVLEQATETSLEALDNPEEELDTYLFLSVPRLQSASISQDWMSYRSIYIYQVDGTYVMQDGPRDPKILSDSDVKGLLACLENDYPARTDIEELTDTGWKREAA